VEEWYIAECYERNSPGDFARFLNIAKGSIGELRTQLYIAGELGYLDKNCLQDMLERSKEISAMLMGLIKSIQVKR
jgi:four helix bundle protein